MVSTAHPTEKLSEIGQKTPMRYPQIIPVHLSEKVKIILGVFLCFIHAEYPVACYVGSKLLQNLYPKGQNSLILHPHAAEIGILKILPVYLSIHVLQIHQFSDLRMHENMMTPIYPGKMGPESLYDQKKIIKGDVSEPARIFLRIFCRFDI